ncbi:hypothetical protein ACFL96_09075 [Thermoproteota archaeon]
MKIKKAIKKVAALGVGVTMMGATLLGATAATYDLSMYPEPFVMDGQFNGLMVVGDDAAPADIIGVTDIAIALQYSSTTTKTVSAGGASGVSIDGDAVQFERSGDILEMNELLSDVVETFDASDAEGLKSFTVSNSKGTTDVNQYLRFSWEEDTANVNSSGLVQYTQDDDDNVGDFLYFDDGEAVYEYELEFEEGFESDIDGTELDDLEDETLHVLGEDFAVTRAELQADADLYIELMGGAVHDTLEEGETRTYTISGKDYEVTVLIITDSLETVQSKFKVNGQVTKQMGSGDTEILSDGTTLGIRELLPNEAGETAGGDLAEFYLGANKITLEGADDDDFSTRADVDINEENVEDVYAYLDFTNDSSTLELHKISWKLNADGAGGDEAYLAPGQGIREWLEEPEGMWSSSWDITYEGLTDPGHSVVEFKARGDDEYRISFENTQGIEYTVPLFYASAADDYELGDDDDALIISQAGTNESDEDYYTANKNDYILLSHNGGQETGVTRVVRLEQIDTSNDQVQLTDAGTGGQITATYTADDSADPTACDETGAGTFNIAGYTFSFRACWTDDAGTSDGDDTHRLLVDLDDTAGLGGDSSIVINGGGMIDIPEPTAGGVDTNASALYTGAANITLTTESDNFDDEYTADEDIEIEFDANDDTELDLEVQNDVANNGVEMNTHEDNDDLQTGMSNYGVYLEEMNEDNDPDSLTINYPLGQVMPQAFIVFEGATVSEGGAGGTVTYEVPNRIEIGAALLASQVSDATAANIISVGGSCVNEVTAELLGLPYPSCGEASGLSEGEGVIKLVENGDNVAVIVAGWDAEDTTRGTRVLGDWATWQDANKLVGMEVAVTGTSLTNYDVTPVTEEVEE